MKHLSQPRPGAPAARLLIVDDHELTRAGLRRILTGEVGLEVVGEASTGREALDQCRCLRPDLVLMDVRMPDLDGLAATRGIKQEHPGAQVVLLTLAENTAYLREALKAGARGYVLKGATRLEIIHALRQVLCGQPVLPPELAADLASAPE